MSVVNGLTLEQDERLTLLIEECSEIIKEACKIQRFGYQSINRYEPEKGTNLERLQLEIGDLDAVIALMAKNGDISIDAINQRHNHKYQKLQEYLTGNHKF